MRPPIRTPGQPAPRGVSALRLLGAFQLHASRRTIPLARCPQRVLAYLALSGHALSRVHLAGVLWPDAPEERALSALRTALWRLRQTDCRLVATSGDSVWIAPEIRVDVAQLRTCEALLKNDPARLVDAYERSRLPTGTLLLDWYDEWVIVERESLRQTQLQVLEALCEQLLRAGRYDEAVRIGLQAVKSDPLRESAHRALISAHLSHGNSSDAVRQFRLFSALLRTQLGLAPSPRIVALMGEACEVAMLEAIGAHDGG